MERHQVMDGGRIHLWSGTFISQTVFMKSFGKSQFPHKSVNVFFKLVNIEDKLTNL